MDRRFRLMAKLALEVMHLGSLETASSSRRRKIDAEIIAIGIELADLICTMNDPAWVSLGDRVKKRMATDEN